MPKTKTPIATLIEELEKRAAESSDINIGVCFSLAANMAKTKLPAERKGYEDAYVAGMEKIVRLINDELIPVPKTIIEIEKVKSGEQDIGASQYFTENYEQ